MVQVASADVHKLAEALRRSGQDSEATTQRVLVEAANFILTEMEVRVPVDTGELRRSLSITVLSDGVRIGPNTPYAAYVEFGTRPHKIVPKNASTLAFTINGRKVYAKAVNHPGTKAQPFVRPAFEAWVERLGGMVAEANVQVIKEHYA
jgi:HK97 gp10 family phage protein